MKIKKQSRVGLRLPPQMRDEIERIAEIRGQRTSEAIRDIMELGIEKLKRYSKEYRQERYAA